MTRKTELDPFLRELIGKLPATGTPWAHADRQAWLKMAEMAFDVVYGRVSDNPIAPMIHEWQGPWTILEPSNGKLKVVPPGPRFLIDRDGYARKGNGDRIMPREVSDIIVDQRGQNGDLGTIIWADDSLGIPKGLQLEISAAA